MWISNEAGGISREVIGIVGGRLSKGPKCIRLIDIKQSCWRSQNMNVSPNGGEHINMHPKLPSIFMSVVRSDSVNLRNWIEDCR